MYTIAIPKENHPGETRIAMTPYQTEKLAQIGAKIMVEKNLGQSCGYADAMYQKAGAEVVESSKTLFSAADMVLRVRKPLDEEVALLKEKAIYISFLNPFQEKDLLQKFADRGVTAISMEMIPRTTRAQKMDALSSQASLAGYVAVLLAASRLPRIFPMMTTAAGTIKPCKVFIIGAGVAGLQAIATAKRLGAKVEAYDTRPIVEEQVQSLGAKFLKFDIGETGQTKDGYAKQLTPEQIAKQRELMATACSSADVIISTAQVFGKKAPIIITTDMISRMKAGSLIVDLAVESGGNVEGVKLDAETEINGVRILGYGNLPGRVPIDSSEMYASNLRNLIQEFWDKGARAFQPNLEDEILRGCVVVHNKAVLQK